MTQSTIEVIVTHEDGADIQAVINWALNECDSVSFINKLVNQKTLNTPVPDEDAGENCHGCRMEHEEGCPCRKCPIRHQCCGQMDAERRSQCGEYGQWAGLI